MGRLGRTRFQSASGAGCGWFQLTSSQQSDIPSPFLLGLSRETDDEADLLLQHDPEGDVEEDRRPGEREDPPDREVRARERALEVPAVRGFRDVLGVAEVDLLERLIGA